MLQTRRLLAFSSRVQTFLLLFLLFCAGLFFLGYLVEMAETTIALFYSATEILVWIQLLWSIFLLLVVLFIWIRDRIFLLRELIPIIIKGSFALALFFLLQQVEALLTYGVVIRI